MKKLFDRSSPTKPESEIANLHVDFKIKEESWYFNRDYHASDGDITIKARFGFDDPTLLDECPFQAKIGINLDDSIPHKYIGFAYANERGADNLTSWAKKFPYAELIDGLNPDGRGVSTPESEVTVLTESDK